MYKIKLWKITLRELMLIMSIYASKTFSHVYQIVSDQPNPLIFYKSFLELDAGNIISMLSMSY